jgi:glycosyltransferase involved in cell wall biosynthesis
VAFLHVTPPEFIGGYERFVEWASTALRAHGHRVTHVVVPQRLVRFAYRLSTGSNQHIPRSTSAGSWLKAMRTIARSDIAYVKNDLLDLAVGATLIRNQPLLIGVHTALANPSAKRLHRLRALLYDGPLYRRLLLRSLASYHVVGDVPAVLGGKDIPIYRIEHPLRHMRPSTKPRRQDQPLRFVFIGRLSYQKGADLLPALAMRLSRWDAPPASLVVAGDGELRPQIERCQAIEYVGPQKDITNLMADADYLLCPSRWEQLPITLVEALSSGTPYILGPAASYQHLALDPALTMRADVVDELESCCRCAAAIAHNADRLSHLRARLVAVADTFPSHEAAYHQFETALQGAVDNATQRMALPRSR